VQHPAAVHRFPGSMAARIQALAAQVVAEYDGQTERLWTEASSGRDLLKRLQALSGFGRQKAQIFLALVGKQLGVTPEGWQEAAGDYARRARSVRSPTWSTCSPWSGCLPSRRRRRAPRARLDSLGQPSRAGQITRGSGLDCQNGVSQWERGS
jgi:hypothetical protein